MVGVKRRSRVVLQVRMRGIPLTQLIIIDSPKGGQPDLRRTLALNRPRTATMEQEVETRGTDVTPWSTIEHDLATA